MSQLIIRTLLASLSASIAISVKGQPISDSELSRLLVPETQATELELTSSNYVASQLIPTVEARMQSDPAFNAGSRGGDLLFMLLASVDSTSEASGITTEDHAAWLADSVSWAGGEAAQKMAMELRRFDTSNSSIAASARIIYNALIDHPEPGVARLAIVSALQAGISDAKSSAWYLTAFSDVAGSIPNAYQSAIESDADAFLGVSSATDHGSEYLKLRSLLLAAAAANGPSLPSVLSTIQLESDDDYAAVVGMLHVLTGLNKFDAAWLAGSSAEKTDASEVILVAVSKPASLSQLEKYGAAVVFRLLHSAVFQDYSDLVAGAILARNDISQELRDGLQSIVNDL